MNKSLPNRAIEWKEQQLILLDQRKLPTEIQFVHINSAAGVAEAIKNMVVRGAPAIGITAAYGVVLSAIAHQHERSAGIQAVEKDITALVNARPTAVNLRWALQRMQKFLSAEEPDWVQKLEQEAIAIHEEDIIANKTIGRLGAHFINGPCIAMTHCNAGALATGGYGTALGVVRSAFAKNKTKVES